MLHVRDGLLVEHIDAGGRALAHGRQKSAPAARQMADASKPRDIVRVVDLPGMEVSFGSNEKAVSNVRPTLRYVTLYSAHQGCRTQRASAKHGHDSIRGLPYV